MKRVIRILIVLAAVGLLGLAFRGVLRRPVAAIVQRVRGRRTVADRLYQYGPDVRGRLQPHFE